MGGGSSKPKNYNVTVNVYDLASNDLNGALSSIIGGGLHHSGIQINNIEYAFGGGSGNSTGVWKQQPQRIPSNSSNVSANGKVPPTFSRSHELGQVTMTKHQMQELFQTLSTEYPCSRYDLISCNCNHFTADACRRLGLHAPDYLNKVANTGEKIMNFGLGMLSAFGSMLEEQNTHGRNGNGSVGGSNSNAGGPEFQIVEGH
jgi:hypothetical protein